MGSDTFPSSNISLTRHLDIELDLVTEFYLFFQSPRCFHRTFATDAAREQSYFSLHPVLHHLGLAYISILVGTSYIHNQTAPHVQQLITLLPEENWLKLYKSPFMPTENLKKQSGNTKTLPKRSISRQLHTDLKRQLMPPNFMRKFEFEFWNILTLNSLKKAS